MITGCFGKVSGNLRSEWISRGDWGQASKTERQKIGMLGLADLLVWSFGWDEKTQSFLCCIMLFLWPASALAVGDTTAYLSESASTCTDLADQKHSALLNVSLGQIKWVFATHFLIKELKGWVQMKHNKTEMKMWVNWSQISSPQRVIICPLLRRHLRGHRDMQTDRSGLLVPSSHVSRQLDRERCGTERGPHSARRKL